MNTFITTILGSLWVAAILAEQTRSEIARAESYFSVHMPSLVLNLNLQQALERPNRYSTEKNPSATSER